MEGMFTDTQKSYACMKYGRYTSYIAATQVNLTKHLVVVPQLDMNCLCTVTLLDCSAYMWLRIMSGLSAGGLFVYLYRVNSTTHLVVPHFIPGTEHVLSLGAALYDWSIWLHWLELLAIHCFAPSPNRILTSWFSGVNL